MNKWKDHSELAVEVVNRSKRYGSFIERGITPLDVAVILILVGVIASVSEVIMETYRP